MHSPHRTALRARREELKFSQDQVAARAGFSPRTVYRLEASGKLPRSAGAVKAYAKALRLSEDDLRALAARAPSVGLFSAGVRASSSCPKRTRTPVRSPGQVAP